MTIYRHYIRGYQLTKFDIWDILGEEVITVRTTMHNGRTKNGRAYNLRHNDRNFDTENADNIDPKKEELNQLENVYNDPTLTFEEAELKFYEETFGAQLQQTNENYIKNGHPERCRTMEEWKSLKRYAPEETVLQIGRKYDDLGYVVDEFTDKDKLMECYRDYNQQLEAWNEAHGKPFTLLNSALHADEDGLPHIHTRRVWHYHENGMTKIGQEKALKAAGLKPPDPDSPVGQNNNRKMTFDAMCRGMWIDVLEAHGISVERTPIPDGKHNRDKEEMIRDKYENLVEASKEVKQDIQTLREKRFRIEESIVPQTDIEKIEAKPGSFGKVTLKQEDWDTVKKAALASSAAMAEAVEFSERLKREQDFSDQLLAERDRSLKKQVETAEQIAFLQAREKKLEEEQEKLKKELKRREQAAEALKASLQKDLSDYLDLKEAKKEAWSERQEAKAKVEFWESVAEDSGPVMKVIAGIALFGARAEAEEAKEKHEKLCAACRAAKKGMAYDQKKLEKLEKDLDEQLKKGVEAACKKLDPPQSPGKERSR